MYLAQAQTICELAAQWPCIFVGRGANCILAERNDMLNVFLYAEEFKRWHGLWTFMEFPGNKLISLSGNRMETAPPT
ncbi:MAG: cytidylate kinase family protein [Agathobacter sp.]